MASACRGVVNVRDEDRAGTHAHMRCRELAAVLGVAFGEACGAMALLRAEDGTGLPRCRRGPRWRERVPKDV